MIGVFHLPDRQAYRSERGGMNAGRAEKDPAVLLPGFVKVIADKRHPFAMLSMSSASGERN